MNNPYEYLQDYVGEPLDYKKEFCPLLGIEYSKNSSGKSKKELLKQLGQYMEIDITGRKVLISKLYSENEIEKILYEKSRRLIKNPLMEKSFCVFNYKDKHRSGIYKIQLDNNIYIGQTKDLYERFRQHWFNKSKTKDLLENGATFSVIEFMDDATSLELQEKENYYINKYLKDAKYNCINKQLNIGTSIKRSKTLKVKLDKYEEAYQLLKECGYLFEEER